MIGLAASPGTDVEPACSTSITSPARAVRILAATAAYCLAHSELASARCTLPWCVTRGRTKSTPSEFALTHCPFSPALGAARCSSSHPWPGQYGASPWICAGGPSATAAALCFEDLGLRRVTATCFADNEASWRLMERAGMRRELYTVRDSLHRSGEWLDGMGYALLADEWRKAPAPGSTSSGV